MSTKLKPKRRKPETTAPKAEKKKKGPSQRTMIYDDLHANPGASRFDIQERTGIPMANVQYHLCNGLKDGTILHVGKRGSRWYYHEEHREQHHKHLRRHTAHERLKLELEHGEDMDPLIWALRALYNRQTVTERDTAQSIDLNQRGFNACHAGKATLIYRKLENGEALDGKDISWMRGTLFLYSRQLGHAWHNDFEDLED